MVFEAEYAGGGAFSLAEIAGGIYRNAGRDETQQHGEDGGKIVQAQMEGQVRQADDQCHGLRRTSQRHQRHQAHRHRGQCAQRKQYLADEVSVARGRQPEQPDGQPGADCNQQEVDRQDTGHGGGRGVADSNSGPRTLAFLKIPGSSSPSAR